MEQQSEERVNHPSWYTQHPSGIECIDLIEHLPLNLGNAIKYLWRCGLKKSETPLRDLKSALWYVEREAARLELFEIGYDHRDPMVIVWRMFAKKIAEKEISLRQGDQYTALEGVLRALLLVNPSGIPDFSSMKYAINRAITALEEPTNAG